MTYDIYLSSLLSLILIWSLVFHSFIFSACLTVVKAVILILKHATLLCLSTFLSSSSALTQVEQTYREANIDLNIREFLNASPQENFIELHAGFIMAARLGLFIASVKIISHQVCVEPMSLDHLVPSQSSINMHVQRKRDHWFKQFLHKSISMPKLKKDW